MQKSYIDITIDAEGVMESTAQGFYGGKCKDVKKVIDGLGKVLESEHTKDVHRNCDQNVEVVPVGKGVV